RRHPLHVARADAAAVAGGVAVLELARIDDRHGFESAVRVHADAAPPRGRVEVARRGIVEHQERGQRLAAKPVIGKDRADRKAVPDPVRRGGVVHGEYLAHSRTPHSRVVVIGAPARTVRVTGVFSAISSSWSHCADSSGASDESRRAIKALPSWSLSSVSETRRAPIDQPLRSAYILSVIAVQPPSAASSRLYGPGPAFCPPAACGSSASSVNPAVSIDCV